LRSLWGGSGDFGKGGGGKGGEAPKRAPKARAPAKGLGAPPENFEKLNAISCNLAYILGIRMASDIIQNWAFADPGIPSGLA